MELPECIGVKNDLPNSEIMQERKNKRLSILLLVLLSATAAVFWFGRERSHYEVDPVLFKNYDVKGIDEILLESLEGKVSLKYSGARWRVNDQYVANTDMIDVLFATLQQAVPKRPLSLSLQDSVSKSLKESGVKVSLRSEGESKEIFYAGGNTSKTQAFFVKENADVPYVMTIPGYRVYVSGIFELGEIAWRDRFVFGFNWRNFQRLEVSYFGKPENNLAVAMDDGLIGIEGLTKVDTAKLNDFLDNVSLLIVDDYLPSDVSLDSLAKTPPIVSFLVKDIARKEYRLQLYPPADPRGQFRGLINTSQWGTFSANSVSEIIRPRKFFVKSE